MIDLEQYLRDSVIEGELLEFPQGTHSAREAAEALEIDQDAIVKSLVFAVDGDHFLVVVQGSARADAEKIAELLEAEDADLLERDAVEDVTGFPAGGVPPIGVRLPKLVDEKVLEQETVYGGGGSGKRILKIDPRFIVDEDTIVDDVVEF